MKTKYLKLWTDMHSNIHHNQMDALEEWYEQAADLLDFWPIAYYPFAMKKLDGRLPVESLISKEDQQTDWQKICAFTKQKNAEGYPMFCGYEWQGNGSDGDHNVFFLNNNEPMLHPMTYQELKEDYQGKAVIAIPHHVAYQPGNRGKNWQTHDEQFSPFAEIYSSHGCSENDDGPMPMERHQHMGPRTGQTCYEEGLNEGYIIGCMASGDNHDLPAVYGNGLMCALTTGKSKAEIWDAFRNRRVYGVCASRIETDFEIADAPMGSVMYMEGNLPFSFQIKGTAPIDRVEVLKNNILERMVVHSGTWEKQALPNTLRFKIRISFGWGPDLRVYPEETHHEWHGKIQTAGKILHVEKCWHHLHQKAELSDEHTLTFDLISDQGGKSDKWMANNAAKPEEMILEIEAPLDSCILLTANDVQEKLPIQDLLASSRILPCTAEAERLIQRYWGDVTYYRSDSWWHNTYKIKLSKAYPESSYLLQYNDSVHVKKAC